MQARLIGGQIIGVVPHGKYTSLGEDPKPAAYLPLFRSYGGYVTLVARARADAQAAPKCDKACG